MKKLIYIILPALILSVACHKETNTPNLLNGKIKSIGYYDSLNVLLRTTNYIYDDSGNLYMLRTGNQTIACKKNADTVILEFTQIDTLTNDTTLSYEYGYLNSQNRIYRVDLSSSASSTRDLYCSYQTTATGVLQEADFNTSNSGYLSKVYDIVFSNQCYTSMKQIVFYSLPPYNNIVYDTMQFNFTFSSIPNNTQIPANLDAISETLFSVFGYRGSIESSKMLSSASIQNSSSISSFIYLQNTLNQIIEIRNIVDGQLYSISKIEYY